MCSNRGSILFGSDTKILLLERDGTNECVLAGSKMLAIRYQHSKNLGDIYNLFRVFPFYTFLVTNAFFIKKLISFMLAKLWKITYSVKNVMWNKKEATNKATKNHGTKIGRCIRASSRSREKGKEWWEKGEQRGGEKKKNQNTHAHIHTHNRTLRYAHWTLTTTRTAKTLWSQFHPKPTFVLH